MIHVYPENDEQPHEIEGTTCPCQPHILWADPLTGNVLPEAIVVHNAFDCRQVVEEAERILEGVSHE